MLTPFTYAQVVAAIAWGFLVFGLSGVRGFPEPMDHQRYWHRKINGNRFIESRSDNISDPVIPNRGPREFAFHRINQK